MEKREAEKIKTKILHLLRDELDDETIKVYQMYARGLFTSEEAKDTILNHIREEREIKKYREEAYCRLCNETA